MQGGGYMACCSSATRSDARGNCNSGVSGGEESRMRRIDCNSVTATAAARSSRGNNTLLPEWVSSQLNAIKAGHAAVYGVTNMSVIVVRQPRSQGAWAQLAIRSAAVAVMALPANSNNPL